MATLIDEYGFEIPSESHEVYTNWRKEYEVVLVRRRERWAKIYPDETYVKNALLKRFIHKGIPQIRRPAVWLEISGAAQLISENGQLYENLIATQSEGLSETTVNQIEADLPRTFPDHSVFQRCAIEPLRRILSAAAKYMEDVGYCQGMNLIAGMILLAMARAKKLDKMAHDEGGNGDDLEIDLEIEKQTFFLLVIVVRHILADYFTPKMGGLLRDLDVLEELLAEKDRPLANHLRTFHLPLGAVASKWMVTAFANCLPSETVFRLWDIMFYDGIKVLFGTVLNLILLQKNAIISAKDSSRLVLSFDSLISYSPVTVDCHHFFDTLLHGPLRIIKSRSHVSDRSVKRLRESNQNKNHQA